jgi:hypothetical protein
MKYLINFADWEGLGGFENGRYVFEICRIPECPYYNDDSEEENIYPVVPINSIEDLRNLAEKYNCEVVVSFKDTNFYRETFRDVPLPLITIYNGYME